MSTTTLAGMAGHSDVRLRWRLASNASVVDEGWAVDDVSITAGPTTSVGVLINAGWNMISNPVIRAAGADSIRQLYRNSSFPYGFRFAGAEGYQQDYTMENGSGFWVKFPGAETNNITGAPLTVDSIAVLTGWNMIGSISDTVDTSAIVSVPSGIILPGWFGYSGGYGAVTQILPGKGYWVKSNADGIVVLSAAPAPKSRRAQAAGVNLLDRLNALTITDDAGNSQTLYFGAAEKGEIPGGMYEMPPLPPAGAFDVRFESGGMMMLTHPVVVNEAIDYSIAVQAQAYPLSVSWDVKSGEMFYHLKLGAGSEMLTGRGMMKLQGNSVNRLALRVSGEGQVPTDYALYQNYPNPFNPTTTISYRIPKKEKISLKVYDLSGREVATLVDEETLPGQYEKRIDAGDLASGVYFCRLVAGNHVMARRLLLLK
jgi:hypothetical protein